MFSPSASAEVDTADEKYTVVTLNKTHFALIGTSNRQKNAYISIYKVTRNNTSTLCFVRKSCEGKDRRS